MGETQQRQTVLEVIRDSKGHMTAEEVFAEAKRRRQGISRSTVYRNLGVLSQQGAILSITAPDCPTYYDHNSIPHGHLVCERCGQLSDVPPVDIDAQKLLPPGFKFLSASLVISCVCDKCLAKD